MDSKPGISAHEALQRLINGNKRSLKGAVRMSGPLLATRALLTRRQRPSQLSWGAVIPGCAGVGLRRRARRAVRCSGGRKNHITEVAGSLQYAGAHLHSPLLVVLGHEGCGAVPVRLGNKVPGRSPACAHQAVGGWHPSGAEGH